MICRDVSWDKWTERDREEFDCDRDGDLDGVIVNQDEDVVMVAARNASRIDLQSKKNWVSIVQPHFEIRQFLLCNTLDSLHAYFVHTGSFALGLAEMIKKMEKELTHCFLA